jgi:hypothetical protein
MDAGPPATPTAEDVVATLRRLEEDLLRPDIRGSAVELEGRLAPDFLEVGSSGRVYDRAAIVAHLAVEADEGRSPVARIEAFAVRLLAPGVALATYRSVRDGGDGGPPAVVLRASIWRLDGGAWQMAFHQGTPTG